MGTIWNTVKTFFVKGTDDGVSIGFHNDLSRLDVLDFKRRGIEIPQTYLDEYNL